MLALVALLAACGGDAETIGRDGSTVVDDPPPAIRTVPLGAYAVTYRVEEQDGDDVRVSEARLVVDRPFRSRFEVERVLRVADFGYFGEREPGDETEVLTAVPAASPGDVRADVLDLGEEREVRSVAGRTCTVHRFGASLLDGLVVDGDTVDACIDGDGIVLEEVTTVDDEIIVRRVATSVDVDPEVGDVEFVLPDIPVRAPDDGGGSVQEVEATSRPPGAFYELDVAPAGFSHLGRYAVVPPQSARLDDERTRAQYLAGVVDVWVRGVDVLIVDQGGTLGQVPPFGAHPHGELVDDLGELASIGEVVRTPTGAEVRVLIPPGRYVKVSGTLPVDDLVELARAVRLAEGDGDGLVYL